MGKIAEVHIEDGKVCIKPEPGAPLQVHWSDGTVQPGLGIPNGTPISPIDPPESTSAEFPEPVKPSVLESFEAYDDIVNAAIENDKNPPKTRNRALSMGLNKYPGCPLSGCVNDAQDILAYATHSEYFDMSMIRMSRDEQNTTEGMRERLKWVLADAQPGDIRLIHYSGHGAQYAGDGHGFQPDHQHDVWCPIDFDWSEEHMIMDVELFEMLKAVPSGVKVWMLSDSCHSGRMVRDFTIPGNPHGRPIKSRAYPWSPSHVKARLKKARENVHRAMIGQTLDIGFGSGCRYDQTSADTSDEHGRPCGAFTHYLLRTLNIGAKKPFTNVIHDVSEALAHNGYEQRPQAVCARVDRPFLT